MVVVDDDDDEGFVTVGGVVVDVVFVAFVVVDDDDEVPPKANGESLVRPHNTLDAEICCDVFVVVVGLRGCNGVVMVVVLFESAPPKLLVAGVAPKLEPKGLLMGVVV